MTLPRFLTGEQSISTKLLMWFLVLALVPCALISAAIEYIASESMEKTVRRGLMVSGENKATALDSFILERRGDAALAGHLPLVVQSVAELPELLKKQALDSQEYEKKVEGLRKIFAHYRDFNGYENAFLFGVDGQLLFRLEPTLEIGANLKEGPLKETELSELFDRAKALLQTVIADSRFYPGHKEPLNFIAAPVFSDEGTNTGVVVLQLGERQISRILEDYNGLGEFGEILVAQERGDEVVFVHPSRFDRDAAFRRKVRLGSAELMPLQAAVQGERGHGEMIDYRGKRCVAMWSYVPSLRWGLLIKQDVDEAYGMIYRQRAVILGLLLGTVILASLVARAIARGLSSPIQCAMNMANKVAEGDLTVCVNVKGKGEAGKLLNAISKMTIDLRTLIGKVQKSSISLLSTATQIAATSKQQEQSVHEYGASTNEAAAAVKQISATGQELLRTMNEVNEVAAETAEMAEQGQESLHGMDKTMRLLADSTGSIGSKLSVISERAANINLVVTTITKVADQTNLLSINAAIEAEKAGEYGLGFLVVAREIRRLADQTAVSTLDIERMVKEMQYSVSAGVMEMDKFSDQVRQGVREVSSLSEQLGKIITAVQGLTGRFDQVTEGMRVQSQGADQIRESVILLSEGVNQTLASLREFNSATAQLRGAVGGLKEEVSRFQVEPVVR
jgi:methyl-accepting chemotaxis protein WspA